MNVSQLMKSRARTCRPDDSLAVAAQLMWDGDCGCAPVVGEGQRIVGMITDRDICMSAYFSGAPLAALTVGDAMAKKVLSCRPDDPLIVAESIMRRNHIRRLPVVDADEQVIGVLSLNDIACEWEREQHSGMHEMGADEVAETLACVSEPRQHAVAAAA